MTIKPKSPHFQIEHGTAVVYQSGWTNRPDPDAFTMPCMDGVLSDVPITEPGNYALTLDCTLLCPARDQRVAAINLSAWQFVITGEDIKRGEKTVPIPAADLLLVKLSRNGVVVPDHRTVLFGDLCSLERPTDREGKIYLIASRDDLLEVDAGSASGIRVDIETLSFPY